MAFAIRDSLVNGGVLWSSFVEHPLWSKLILVLERFHAWSQGHGVGFIVSLQIPLGCDNQFWGW